MTAATRIVLTRIKPTGDLPFGDVRDGEIIERAWSCTVNAPPTLMSMLDNGVGDDVDQIARFSDCALIYNGRALARVTAFAPNINIQTREWRAGGTRQTKDVDLGYKLTLTFTETVISDATGSGGLFEQVLRNAIAGTPTNLTMQVVYKPREQAAA